VSFIFYTGTELQRGGTLSTATMTQSLEINCPHKHKVLQRVKKRLKSEIFLKRLLQTLYTDCQRALQSSLSPRRSKCYNFCLQQLMSGLTQTYKSSFSTLNHRLKKKPPFYAREIKCLN